MRARRTILEMTCSGISMEYELSQSAESFSYADKASGESDTINLNISDRSNFWTGAWQPTKKDFVTAKILLIDWLFQGDVRTLDCGLFQLDDYGFSSPPRTGRIQAISSPMDANFKGRERTKTWEKVSIQEIAAEIAGRYGLQLDYDADTITIEALEQTKKDDCSFLSGLCSEYGLQFKVYSWKLVIFDIKRAKARPPLVLRDGDLVSWSWDTQLLDVYTGGEFVYTDPYTEKTITVKLGDQNGKVLKLNQSASDRADAERQLIAALEESNRPETTMNIMLMGRTDIFASNTVQIVGMGCMDGKYYIESASHNIGSGYTVNVSMSLIQ